MRHRIEALVFAVGLAQGAGLAMACTPAQRQHARTAQEVNQCVTAISLRHIDAGDDFRDPLVTARIAAEVTDECGPLLVGKDGG